MNTSSRSIVCGSGERRCGSTVMRQVHSSREPRLGAARAAKLTPGSSKRGASADRMTCIGHSSVDRQADLTIMDGMTANAQPGLDFGILLAIGYQEFVRALRASMAASGFDDLGRSDGYVLRALDSNPLTVSALAELLDITKQGAAQIVDDMGARGYVERRESTVDRRARPLYLTERGRQALAAARRFHRR